MSETKQTQFLTLFDSSTVYYRWQRDYINKTVQWEGQSWSYQSFAADGITEGDGASESSLVVSLPATKLTMEAFRAALANGWLALLRQYEFSLQPGQDPVPDDQRLIASYIGEVIGGRGSLSRIEMELGSAIAPVGVQIPPRTYSSYLIGVPAQL